MNMTGWAGRQGRDFASDQVCPRPAFSLGTAGQPAFLPGLTRLVLQPVQQPGKAAGRAPMPSPASIVSRKDIQGNGF